MVIFALFGVEIWGCHEPDAGKNQTNAYVMWIIVILYSVFRTSESWNTRASHNYDVNNQAIGNHLMLISPAVIVQTLFYTELELIKCDGL